MKKYSMLRLSFVFLTIIFTFNLYCQDRTKYSTGSHRFITLSKEEENILRDEYRDLRPSDEEILGCLSVQTKNPIWSTGHISIGKYEFANYGPYDSIGFGYTDKDRDKWHKYLTLKGPEKHKYRRENLIRHHTVSVTIQVYTDAASAKGVFMSMAPPKWIMRNGELLQTPAVRSFMGQKIGEISYTNGHSDECYLRIKIDRILVSVDIYYLEDEVNGKDVDCVAKLIVNKIADKYKLHDLLKEDKPDPLKLNRE